MPFLSLVVPDSVAFSHDCHCDIANPGFQDLCDPSTSFQVVCVCPPAVTSGCKSADCHPSKQWEMANPSQHLIALPAENVCMVVDCAGWPSAAVIARYGASYVTGTAARARASGGAWGCFPVHPPFPRMRNNTTTTAIPSSFTSHLPLKDGRDMKRDMPTRATEPQL